MNTRYSSVQDAIDAAESGDTIFLNPGVYRGRGNRDITVGDKRLRIVSSHDDPSTCVLDLEDNKSHRGFLFDGLANPDSTLLRGITIRGGKDKRGGGILCVGDPGAREIGKVKGSPRIENCIVTDCKATADGGGICLKDGSAAVLTDVRIHGNSAGENGGGLAIEGLQPVLAATGRMAVVLTRCEIRGNSAGAKGGGAWVAEGSRPRFVGGAIRDNEAKTHGGGIAVETVATKLIDVRIGGVLSTMTAAYIHGSEDVPFLIERNVAGKDGGGLWARYAYPFVRDCQLLMNRAGRDGGGLALDTVTLRRLVDQTPLPQDWESVRYGNDSNIPGGGAAAARGNGQLERCVVEGNATGSVGRGGGAYLGAGCSIFANRVMVLRNVAMDGGGVFVMRPEGTESGCALVLSNAVINENRAVSARTGVGGVGAGFCFSGGGPIEIWLSTICDNEAMVAGGGLWIYDEGAFDCHGVLLYHNVAGDAESKSIARVRPKSRKSWFSPVTLGHCNIEGGVRNSIAPVSGLCIALHGDPRLSPATSETRFARYRLQPDSFTCIDRGPDAVAVSSQGAVEYWPTDVDGRLRVVGQSDLIYHHDDSYNCSPYWGLDIGASELPYQERYPRESGSSDGNAGVVVHQPGTGGQSRHGNGWMRYQDPGRR